MRDALSVLEEKIARNALGLGERGGVVVLLKKKKKKTKCECVKCKSNDRCEQRDTLFVFAEIFMKKKV